MPSLETEIDGGHLHPPGRHQCGRSGSPPTARFAAILCAMTTATLAAQGAGSSDATLAALVVNDGGADIALSPVFDPDTTDYTADIDSGVRVVTVTATPTDDAATVASEPDDDDADADGIQVPVAVGDNTIAVTVTAQDGSERTYRVTVTRAPYCTEASDAVNAVSGTPSAELISDCNILMDAKEILEGPEGTPLNWSADLGMNGWTAIEVSGERVTKLDVTMDDDQPIFSESLRGELPPTLGGLSALTVLRFSHTSLRGEIPEQLGDLSELAVLNLASNRCALFAWCGGLEGSIPSRLGDLRRLEILDLGGNKLSGSIPPSLRHLKSLKTLGLGRNVDVDFLGLPLDSSTGLEGQIPIALLKELPELDDLDLAFNRLTGTIPRELGELDGLNTLQLYRNFLTGCIPPAIMPFDHPSDFKGINPQRNPNNVRTRDLPLCPVPERPSARILWARGDEMAVSYRAASAGEPVSRFEYRLSADAGSTWNPDWTAIPDSASGGVNAGSFTIGGLSEGTAYIVELRAVNVDGPGPATSFSGTPEPYPDTALRSLVLRHGPTGVTMSPGFSFDRLRYTVMVGVSVDVLTIIATPTTRTATVSSDPGDADTAEGIQVRLRHGINTVALTVTADDGGQWTYRLTVVRNPTDEPAGLHAQPGELSLDEGTTVGYTLVLAAAPAAEVTVAINVVGSGSIRASPARLTFTTSNWSSHQTVNVRALTDADDANERARLRHSATGAGHEIVPMPEVTVTAWDDNDAWAPRHLRLEGRDGKVVIVYDRQLDGTSVPAPGDYTVTVNGETLDVVEVEVSGVRVTLTLERDVRSGQVTIDYTPGANPLRGVPDVGSERGSQRVLLFESASNPDRQGFVRIINHSDEDGAVSITAVDDAGVRSDSVSLAIAAGESAHFNADDLESGNAEKGLPDGVGAGSIGDWRLELASELDIEVLSYARTTDGFVTSLHDSIPVGPDAPAEIVFLNPGRNINQVSHLRLVNMEAADANVTIRGIDDMGMSGGEVTAEVRAGWSVNLTAAELESGSGQAILNGVLGEGTGKWRLSITSDVAITAMSLLESQGRLTNLTTAPRTEGGSTGSILVPLFPSASDPDLKGFVRVINRSDEAGEVSIEAFDDTDRNYDTVTLSLGANATAHFNSEDVEMGNADKGLTGSTGSGEGDWRLELVSDLDIQVLAYIRTDDGFVTAMHDLAPVADEVHRVVFLNPGKNEAQVSRIRLLNPGTTDATVTITGIDSAGASPGDAVQATVPAAASLALTAQELESGQSDDIDSGSLGVGQGKWRLRIESAQPIHVISLLRSPTGHLTNLSTSPGRSARGSSDQEHP